MFPEQEAFFEQLYRNLFPGLKIYANKYLRDWNQAEEIVQDTFHEALQKIDILMCHENPEAWLVITLQNKIRNCERANMKRRKRIIPLDISAVESVSITDFTAESVLDEMMMRDAERQIDQKLTPDEKYLLRRLVCEQATHRDVAKELGISVWTSQKRLERIRNKLEDLFPGYRRKRGKKR